ncbi:MAG: N-6 DNA methylase [Armatimonadota bacterium]|nr:N-6 DNA methylase [bacterium]
MPYVLQDPQTMLEAAYKDLHFEKGSLLDAVSSPGASDPENWLNRGEWLSLANTVSAEKIFFVGDNPVVVFAKHYNADPDELRQFVNRIWCMSRPRFLFLAMPGDLRVLDLSRPPVGPGESIDSHNRVLGGVKAAADVQRCLSRFRAEELETGRLLNEDRLPKSCDRADQALIRDLRTIREQLQQSLDVSYVHALLGRSIFIRYLEDRGIIDEEYFLNVAHGHPEWQAILEAPLPFNLMDEEMHRLLYPRVLNSKEFTYALFAQIAKDFNGDAFPSSADENDVVTSKHLRMLQRFLVGAADNQLRLFFHAYKFDVIPIELISSIYEEFYKAKEDEADNGTHYTPDALVEYVLSQVLDESVLQRKPRIIDPSCGSGIFLVKAYRRLVRYKMRGLERELNRNELREIMRDQLAGIDINPEAVRVAAFSLYLALLDCQEPKDIRHSPRLPNLLKSEHVIRDPDQYFDTLLVSNAFDIEGANSSELSHGFGDGCFDVVIGNPPWGSPRSNDKEGKKALQVAKDWCEDRGYTAGDDEYSQLFIHRAMDLLAPGGRAGLLVSTGVFFKHENKSRQFREQWLTRAKLVKLTNFAHLADTYFAGAAAPFACVVFDLSTWNPNHRFEYWSAKKTSMAAKLRSVVLSRADLKSVSQADALAHDEIWKIYWWGGHMDWALVRALRAHPNICQLDIDGKSIYIDSGVGFMDERKSSSSVSSKDIAEYKVLPTKHVWRYGPLPKASLVDVPKNVSRLGNKSVYQGLRLVVRRGVQKELQIRLDNEPYCFKHSVFGIRLNNDFPDVAKIIVGICWSSLARYYLWMTVGSWGPWHNAIHKHSILDIPIRLPEDEYTRTSIVRLVDELSSLDPRDIYDSRKIHHKKLELDEAILDLYQLTVPERERVCDMIDYELDLFFNKWRGSAVKPVSLDGLSKRHGVIDDLHSSCAEQIPIEGYLQSFLSSWSYQLEPDEEFCWRIVQPHRGSSMLAVIFSSQFRSEPLPPPEDSDEEKWQQLLQDLAISSLQTHGASNVLIDGILRVVSATDIVIIKRDERRLWTRSAAREDAEATLAQAMLLEDVQL